jgi:hypothetical protein
MKVLKFHCGKGITGKVFVFWATILPGKVLKTVGCLIKKLGNCIGATKQFKIYTSLQ